MTWVIDEQYERAIQELKGFLQKDFDYPEYTRRIERYIGHCVDLVHAIRAKRRFPGVKSLTMAKQQELKEKFHQHFEELQEVMAKIEKIHNDLKLADIRSTVLVVRAAVNAAFMVAVVAFFVELVRGQGQSTLQVVDAYLKDFIDFINQWLYWL